MKRKQYRYKGLYTVHGIIPREALFDSLMGLLNSGYNLRKSSAIDLLGSVAEYYYNAKNGPERDKKG